MNIRPIAVLLLMAALIWGCETTDPLIRDAQDALQTFDYERAIMAAEQAIEEDSSNALAYYYKGAALGSLAEDIQPPSDRLAYYEEMRNSLSEARYWGEQMESRPDELGNINDIINSVWANEHNAGAMILTDDSTRQATPNPEETARDHFINATTVQPDSSISYIVLSSIQYQLGNIPDAIENYEHAMSLTDQPLVEDYEFLISLYFVEQRYEDAEQWATEAMEAYPEEESFVQFLADIYMERDEGDQAIALLQEMIERNPNNEAYFFALGTQLFRSAQNYLDEAGSIYQRAWSMEEQAEHLTEEERADLLAEVESMMEEAEELEARGNELADEAVERLEGYLDLVPDDDSAYNILGIIYQNRAAALFDKRNQTLDNELAMEYDEQARENLQISREHYERATELNPEETEYWEALFQVYTTLGMDEEADMAAERAGFDDETE